MGPTFSETIRVGPLALRSSVVPVADSGPLSRLGVGSSGIGGAACVAGVAPPGEGLCWGEAVPLSSGRWRAPVSSR